MAAIDVVNRVYREFRRYTGDGLPNEPAGAPLPVGDPSSGVHNPKKSELRSALLAPIEDATAEADRAEAAADEVEAALGGLGSLTEAVADAEAAAAAAAASAASVSGMDISVVQGRLSLTSDTPSPASDVTGATTIYYVPVSGKYAPVYDGTKFVARSIGAQISLALDANTGHTGYQESGKNWDLFVIYNGGQAVLATASSWNAGAVAGSDTARGTGAGSTELEVFGGIAVNKVAIVARFGSGAGDTVNVAARQATYVGSFRATAHGQATDTKRQRFLFNAYNQILRPMKAVDANVNWSYGTGGIRQARGSALNQVEFLLGMAGIAVEAQLSCVVGANADVQVQSGIGLDSTTTFATDATTGWAHANSTQSSQMVSRYDGFPGLGFHRLTWLESAATAATVTWFGTIAGTVQSGLLGRVVG